MSIAIAIADRRDIVLVTDTRLTGDNGLPESDEMQKSSALSSRMILAMTGDLKPIRLVIGATGFDLAAVANKEVFSAFESWCLSGEHSYDAMTSRIADAATIWSGVYREQLGAAALLCDWNDGMPRMYLWQKGNGGTEVWRGKAFGADIGKTPNDAGAYKEMRRIIDYDKGTGGAEKRLLRAVQFAAEHEPENTISNRIYARRFSEKWVPELISS